MEALKRHEPLYLKHRPQSLAELVGQDSVTRTLSNAIDNERIAHAYLFTGPRGTGKTSSARILAKSLNCKQSEKATATPCQECTSCLEIRHGNSPAVFEIDAASNNSVDDARVLIERAPLVAPGGRYKIYIIDECHMLTKEAFNALLKTIEDPPPNVIFILATTEEHKVLPTIVSRCQRLMFRLVSQADLVSHLASVSAKENIEITEDALALVARRSGGGLRDALGLLDQASLLSAPGKPVTVTDLLNLLGALHEDVLLAISDQVLNHDGRGVLSSISSLLQDGREPAVIVQEMARHFLNLMKASYLSGTKDQLETVQNLVVGSPEYLKGLCELAPKFDKSELSQIVEALDRLEQTCRRTTQPAMHLEVGLLSLCHRQDMVIVRDLSERIAKLEKGIPSSGIDTRSGAAASASPRPPAPHATPAPVQQAAPVQVPAPAQQVAPPSQSTPAPAPQAAVAAVPPSAPAPLPQGAAAPLPQPAPAVNDDESGNQPSAPVPTPAPVATSQVVESNGQGNEGGGDDLDHFWSQMLDELQRRHLPTHSLASSQGYPLRLTSTELVVGAPNETLQKSLEQKAHQIKAACAAIGKDVHVKVQVARKEFAPPAATPKPRERTSAPAPSAESVVGEDDDLDGPRISSLYPEETSASAGSYPPQMSSPSQAPPPAHQPMPAMAQRPPAGISDSGEQSTHGAIIKEAYKLFEGPGSRRLGSD